MSKDSKNVPALRFKGFSDAWEKRKLGEVTSKIKSYALTRAFESSEITGFKYIHYGDIHTRKDRIINNASELQNIKAGNYISLQDRDLVLADASEDYKGIADAALLENTDGFSVVAGLHTIALRSTTVSTVFLFYMLQTTRFKDFARKMGTGLKVFGITYDNLSKYQIYVPCAEEQANVVKTVRTVENLIAATQQKLDNLRQVKKSMAQHLLDKSIRFREYSATWEKRKLGDLLKERNVQHPQSSEYPLVSFTVENGVTPKTERYEREQLVRGDKQAKRYKETRLDDIVYNPANLKFGAIARNSFGKAVFSPIYVTFEVNQELALARYVELLVTQNSFMSRALRYQQGTVYERQSVSPRDLLNLSVALPDKEEQTNISLVFSRLDKLIMTTQSQLSTFKILKKSLLKNLFV